MAVKAAKNKQMFISDMALFKVIMSDIVLCIYGIYSVF